MKKTTTLTIILVFTCYVLMSQDFSFEYDGHLRTYRVHLPAGYDAEIKYPMVINMHGVGSNAMEQEYYSQFNVVADTAGVIMVYPNGLNNAWNIYQDTGVDDVGFISALIDTMAASYQVDLKRVYATGMSMGGFMSHRLACQLSNKIAAIGSVAGTLAYPTCSPKRPVPVCQIHGTDDSTVFYYFVPTTMAYWRQNNGCGADSVITELPDTDTTDQSTVTLITYGPCEEQNEVRLYRVNGGEHTWPGATYIIGVTNNDIHASGELWNFFKRFTLPDGVGVEEQQRTKESRLLIAPNPVSTLARITIEAVNVQEGTLRLIDFSGRTIHVWKTDGQPSLQFDRVGIPSGMYILEYSNGNVVACEKVILE